MIEKEGPDLAWYKNLMSMEGIGPVRAAVLLGVIDDIRDFPDAGKLAACPGQAPAIQNSNETERSGRITMQGNKLARTCLVQCALIAKRYSSMQQSFYQRIQRWRGDGKTNIALARKSLGSSATPSRITGSSRIPLTSSWPPENRPEPSMSRQLFTGEIV